MWFYLLLAVVAAAGIFLRLYSTRRLLVGHLERGLPGDARVPYPLPVWPGLGHVPLLVMALIKHGAMAPSFAFAWPRAMREAWGESRYKGIYRFFMAEGDQPFRYFATSSDSILANDLFDDKVTKKSMSAMLVHIEGLIGRGLFVTLDDEGKESDWQRVHKLLAPVFSFRGVTRFIPAMHKVLKSMRSHLRKKALKGEVVDINVDATRLTFDTIGECAFSEDFGSFADAAVERNEEHPYVAAIRVALETAQALGVVPPALHSPLGLTKKMKDASETMNDFAHRIVSQHREDRGGASGAGATSRDLIDDLIAGGIDDDLIVQNLHTVGIAGQETSASLIAYALYELVQHPSVMRRAREEADRVLGGLVTDDNLDPVPSMKDVKGLKFMRNVLREALRLHPPAPGVQRTLKSGQEHSLLKQGDVCFVMSAAHQRDPAVWGPHAHAFDPDRWDERTPSTSEGGFSFFGVGRRSCIGQEFAQVEVALALSDMVRNFDFSLHDPEYQLADQQSLTLRPAGLMLNVAVRPGPLPIGQVDSSAAQGDIPLQDAAIAAATDIHSLTPEECQSAVVAYGSNMGACKEFAFAFAQMAGAKEPVALDSLVSASVVQLPPVLIVITATYNGEPPSNAAAFHSCALNPDGLQSTLKGTRFAVFGIGNRDWTTTFHKVPHDIDGALRRFGEQMVALSPLEVADVLDGDADERFEVWAKALLKNASQDSKDLPVELDISRAEGSTDGSGPLLSSPPAHMIALHGVQPRAVISNEEGQNPDVTGRSTRLVRLDLKGLKYVTGDHVGILAPNSQVAVARAVKVFSRELPDGANSKVSIIQGGRSAAHLPPQGAAMRACDLLAHCIDLNAPASTRLCKRLRVSPDAATEGARKLTVLEILELAQTPPSLSSFLELAPMMKPRFYSSASSSAESPLFCDLAVGVQRDEGFEGVASTHVAAAQASDALFITIRDVGGHFRLPVDTTVPMLLIGAGTGVAPLRGFAREPERTGRVVLFQGCRSEADQLYKNEFETDSDLAAHVQVIPAYSRHAAEPKQYVQDALRANAKLVRELVLESNANIFVCGDAIRMEPAVRSSLLDILSEGETALSGRYFADVWG